MGKQHHYPAALIGNFSPELGPPRRKRRVHCARRGVTNSLRQPAENLGVTPRHPHVYDAPAGSEPFPMDLDELWLMAEPRIESVAKGIDEVEQTGMIEPSRFVMDVAPFVAQLLARHPRLTESGLPDLVEDPSLEARTARWAYMGILVDTVLFRTRWTLTLAPAEVPWTSNDMGAIWLPGRGAGNVLVLLDPRRAVMLSAGTPNYELGAEQIRIRSYEWTADDAAVINEVIARTAPFEVYARERDQAETAIRIWTGNEPTTVSTKGIPAECLSGVDSRMAPRMMLDGTALDFELSWARYQAATHQFACNCLDLFDAHEPATAEEAHLQMQALLDRGCQSLTGPQGLRDSSDPGRGVFIKEGYVAEANRAGLLLRRSPCNVEGYVRPPA